MSKQRNWFGSTAKRNKKSKLRRSRLPWIETLGRRELLYAALQNVQLFDDTDTPGDLTTSDPRVTGTVTGDFMYGADIEFDHDADGMAEGLHSIGYAGEQFAYDPRDDDPSLSSFSGTFLLQMRVVEYDEYYMPMTAGAWQDFTFTINSGGSSSDPGDDLASAQTVSLTTGVTSEVQAYVGDGLYGSGDVDLFKVNLLAGQTINVDIDAEYLDDGSWYSSLDSHVRLFNSSGLDVANNGNGLSGNDYEFTSYDSYLSFTATATADFYIGVSAAGNEYYDPVSTPGMGYGSSSGDDALQLLVTEGGANQASSANDDNYTVDQDSTLAVSAAGVV